jgi:putative DNA methylase
MTNDRRWFSPPLYGLPNFADLFTSRQLVALSTFSDLVRSVRQDVISDAKKIGNTADAEEYAAAITTFLGLALGRCSDFNNAMCRWKPSGQQIIQLFSRQAIPMVWDFAEANIMGDSAICWHTAYNICADAIESIVVGSHSRGNANQEDAANSPNGSNSLLVSTDPPYYDNIGYAPLSDFFYVWHRRTLHALYPGLFSTVLVPKMPELTAAAERFGGDKQKAKEHFESGFRKVFTGLRHRLDPRYPLTVYYAFKQEDEEESKGDEMEAGDTLSLTTGWETLLEALLSSGFGVWSRWGPTH